MCSNNRNGVCGGRNAIAYSSDNCGCSNNNSYSNCGCENQNGYYDNSCGSNSRSGNSCGYGDNGNVLCSAASGFASTVFRVVRGLDRSISGCGCNNGSGNNNGCGCGNNNSCGCGCN